MLKRTQHATFVGVGREQPAFVDGPRARWDGICPRCLDLSKLAEDGFCNRKNCRAVYVCKQCGNSFSGSAIGVSSKAKHTFCSHNCRNTYGSIHKMDWTRDFWTKER